MRIYITGCARSGTTLMKRLFYAFENTFIVNTEINIFRFAFVERNVEAVIGKRTVGSFLSSVMTDEAIQKSIRCIQKFDIKILNMIRNGKDVLSSGQILAPRWLACIDQKEKYREFIDLEIKYEDLVVNPDRIQIAIAENYGLRVNNLFSEYPVFLPKHMTEVKSERTKMLAHKKWGYRNKERPIDTLSVRGSAGAYTNFLADEDKEKFERYNQELGYN